MRTIEERTKEDTHMSTTIARFLRKLRIDNGEILRDMAEKLGVSTPFLSAVENGKKKVPDTWLDKIVSIYQLTAEQQTTLKKAIDETAELIKLNIKNSSAEQKDLAMCFARKFETVDRETAEKIKKLLERG